MMWVGYQIPPSDPGVRLPSHRAPLNIGDCSPVSSGHGPKFQPTDKFRRKWKGKEKRTEKKQKRKQRQKKGKANRKYTNNIRGEKKNKN